MLSLQNDQLLQLVTTYGSLLYSIKLIWDEMGESDKERDKMLLHVEK
jgi:protein regulator of cytokinesis 1